MKFTQFPFDSHLCYLEMRNWLGTFDRVQLKKPILYLNSMNKSIPVEMIKEIDDSIGYDIKIRGEMRRKDTEFLEGGNY